MTDSAFTQLCKELEHFETPKWAAEAILRSEILTERVIDPCAGSGVLCNALDAHGGYAPDAMDIHDWGFPLERIQDWLAEDPLPPHLKNRQFSVMMNPPFSKACEFVEQAIRLGARKILCFQRFAWWESAERSWFWHKNPPNRIYICGNRASCWRHDIPLDQRGSSSPTAHAWFVWEKGQPSGTLLGHIYKDEKKPEQMTMGVGL